MPVDRDSDLIIVSDLHLSAGYDPRLGTYDRNEDFFYDNAFARFLAHLRRRATEERRHWRLVLLGDVFDFLQVELPRQAGEESRDPLDRSEAVTLAKLERVVRGHPGFFRALGEFAAAGFPIDVMPGNHDIEMIRPATQARFVELVVEAVGLPEVAGAFSFYPWIYYVPGMVYAEHGHQYDETNSFVTQLQPYIDPNDPDRIDLPLGSYFVEYLFNRIEAVDPFADNIRPPSAYFLWALRTHPLQALATFGAHIGFFLEVLRRTDNLPQQEVEERRRRYRETTLRRYAPAVELSEWALTAIDELAAVPAMSSKVRQLQAILVQPILEGTPAAAYAAAATVALLQFQRSRHPLGFLGAGVASMAWRERRRFWKSDAWARDAARRPGGYLRAAAERIDTILRADGNRAPFYVFGHTHLTEQFALTDEAIPPRYINSGTWTPLISTEFEILSDREQFSFVEILRGAAGGPPTATLRYWKDSAGRDEILPLLAVTEVPIRTAGGEKSFSPPAAQHRN